MPDGGLNLGIKNMKKLGTAAAVFLCAMTANIFASPAEQQVADAIKSPDLTVVHLWAPWCSNCKAELKSGGWTKMVKDNPKVKFLVRFRLEQR